MSSKHCAVAITASPEAEFQNCFLFVSTQQESFQSPSVQVIVGHICRSWGLFSKHNPLKFLIVWKWNMSQKNFEAKDIKVQKIEPKPALLFQKGLKWTEFYEAPIEKASMSKNVRGKVICFQELDKVLPCRLFVIKSGMGLPRVISIRPSFWKTSGFGWTMIRSSNLWPKIQCSSTGTLCTRAKIKWLQSPIKSSSSLP